MSAAPKHTTAERLHRAGCPERFIGGLERYVDGGILPGGFLQAVLAADYRAAIGRADPSVALLELADLVSAVESVVPPELRGSWVVVDGRGAI